MKKKTGGPGEALMWFSVGLIIIGIVLGLSSYIGDVSITSIGLTMAIVGAVVAVLARTLMR